MVWNHSPFARFFTFRISCRVSRCSRFIHIRKRQKLSKRCSINHHGNVLNNTSFIKLLSYNRKYIGIESILNLLLKYKISRIAINWRCTKAGYLKKDLEQAFVKFDKHHNVVDLYVYIINEDFVKFYEMSSVGKCMPDNFESTMKQSI